MVIPTYNWATVLPWSIGSVLAQSFAEWELWVIGDGCTDESAATVATFDDPRVHWHNLAVNGRSQVGPNNAALARADGGYVAYLGHDDLWLPHHLQILVGALDAGAAFAFGRQLRIDPCVLEARSKRDIALVRRVPVQPGDRITVCDISRETNAPAVVAALDAGAAFAFGRQLRIDPGQRPYVSPPDGYSYSSGDWLAPTSMIHRRDDARAVGGWRFPDAASTMDAESDLWARLTRWCGHPSLLGEVTSLKLPAALRSGVYRERPCDEQAAWWARICAAADPAAFVAEALADGELRPPARYETGPASAALQDGTLTAVERHRLARTHKGLDDS